MTYSILNFESAAQKQGYVIERIKKNGKNNVDSMFGSVTVGTLVRAVRWDQLGQCFSRKGKALPKYDLQLEDKE